MEDRLKYILSLVNDWLKFAESKNAALLAADTALGLGLYKILRSDMPGSQSAILYVGFVISLLFVGAFICLVSFIPRTTIPWLATTHRPKEDDNLLFYGDIAKYDPKRYIASLYKQSGNDVSEIKAYEEDLAEQIIINSRIALQKYGLFKTALWINVIAGVTPIGAFILWGITKMVSYK